MKETDRFRVMPPAPLQGYVGWGVFDEELNAIVAFAPAKAWAERIVESLNKHHTVKP